MQRIPHLFFGPSEIGDRGVFTTKKIPKGSVIEICPVIVLPVKDLKLIDKTVVFNYYFEWGDDADLGAIALGYGSLYNHSYEPNARYLADYEMGTLDIHAIKDIPAGSEIFTNYNGEPTDKSKLWFKAR